MNCAEYQDRLSAYIDGELARWSRVKLERHLRGCLECRAVMRELQQQDEAIRTAIQALETPDYLSGAVMHRIPALPPARRARAVWPWVGGMALAGAQAAALVAAWVWGFQSAVRTAGSPSSQPTVSASSNRGSMLSADPGVMPVAMPAMGLLGSRPTQVTAPQSPSAVSPSAPDEAKKKMKKAHRIRGRVNLYGLAAPQVFWSVEAARP